jgi:hypothetical protein
LEETEESFSPVESLIKELCGALSLNRLPSSLHKTHQFYGGFVSTKEELKIGEEGERGKFFIR